MRSGFVQDERKCLLVRQPALAVVFSFLFAFTLSAQENLQNIPRDTVDLKAGDVLVVNQQTYYIRNDTTFYIPSSVNYRVRSYRYGNADSIYTALYKNNKNPDWLKNIIGAVFLEDGYASKGYDNETSSESFLPYSGQHISQIRIIKLDPFGSSNLDTTQSNQAWYARAANYIHINTSDRIIKKHLLFSKGERLNPNLLAENERILRSLPYFVDARIFVEPSDTVSGAAIVNVVVKDLWSKAFGFNPDDFESGELRLWDRNIFGFGHEMTNYIYWDGDEQTPLGYEGDYRVRNLGRSFVDLRLGYLNSFGNLTYRASLGRDFFSYLSRYAGGLHYENSVGLENIMLRDTSLRDQSYKVDRFGAWMGYSFPLNGHVGEELNLVVALKYGGEEYQITPAVTSENALYRFHTKHTYLGSLALTRQEFRKSNLIYSFGRTEDLPLGFKLELTGGWEYNKYYNRPYAGIHFSHAVISPVNSYLNAGAGFGGFFRNREIEQGVLNASVNSFSKLMQFGDFRLRNFLNLNYTRGIKRFEDEYVSISNNLGITGLSSSLLRGTQKLNVGIESVVFTPLYVYGFRFAYYFFADWGWIGYPDRTLFKSPFYSGYGMGIRFRNERMVFNTVQIRFVFYPRLPSGTDPSLIQATGEPRLRPENFFIREPGVMEYR